MSVRTSILLTSLVACCPVPAQAPRRTLGDETRSLLENALGRPPFEVLAAWTHGEEPSLAELEGARAERLSAAWLEALVCGLWSKDPDVAFAAACLVPESRLDLADIDRWLEVVWPHVFDATMRYDWDTLKHVVDTEQVGRLLKPREVWRSDARQLWVRDLHRSVRPVHIPALIELSHHPDVIVRQQAFEVLSWAAVRTNRYREAIAREVLRWPGCASLEGFDYDEPATSPPYRPRSFELGAEREGFSPLLRATLRRWFLDVHLHEHDPTFDAWLLRWADDEVPAAADRPLLLALLGSHHDGGRWTGLRGLRRLLRWVPHDDATTTALEDVVHGADYCEQALALAALGDRTRLLERAAGDSRALAVALEGDPEPAWSQWSRQAFGGDPAAGLEAIERLADAADCATYAPVRFPESVRARLRRAVDAAVDELDWPRLHALAAAFPGCRTDALCARYLAELTPERLDTCLTPMLEVYDEDAFVARLQRWALQSHDGRAIALLLELGQSSLGPPLLQGWRQQESPDLFVLARCGAVREIAAYLRDRVAAIDTGVTPDQDDLEPLAAYAMLGGMPESVCRYWAKALAGVPRPVWRARSATWRRQVLAGDPVAALVDWLTSVPPQKRYLRDLGLVRDARVLDMLRELRRTPGTDVQWVIGELALAGEPPALAELAQVRARHLYGWMDDASANVRTLGRSLELVPYWIDEIETSCCRRNGAAFAIDSLTGFDVHRMAEHGLLTQHDYAQAWWHRVSGHLHWSRLAERYVVR